MDEELQRLARIASREPTTENLARLGAAYLRAFGVRYSIEIIGRRWFQKSMGNTYHTVQILLNGELLAESEMNYGYGDHYLQTAMDLIAAHTDLKPTWPLTVWARENGVDLRISVQDVSRRRDL